MCDRRSHSSILIRYKTHESFMEKIYCNILLYSQTITS